MVMAARVVVRVAVVRLRAKETVEMVRAATVSYTHLTLPTNDLV